MSRARPGLWGARMVTSSPTRQGHWVGDWPDHARAVPRPNPNGILILDASGRYAVGIAAPSRPKFSTGNRLEARAEEYKAATIGFMATFGTWSLNEADKTLTFHHEGAVVPNFEGADSKGGQACRGSTVQRQCWRPAPWPILPLLKAEPLPAATARPGLRSPLRIVRLDTGVVNTVLMAHLDQKTPGRC